MINKNKRIVTIIASLLLYVSLSACSKGKKMNGFQQVAPVTAAYVTKRTMPIQIHTIGNVQAISSVDVNARVGGELLSAYFKEGQYVKKGHPMLLIDPRPFKIALEQAKANLMRDEAQLNYDLENLRRYTKLVAKDYVTRDQYDQVKMQGQSLSATVEADKSQVDNAKLQLSYCYIDAPVSGRTGSLLVKPGNIVSINQPNSTTLVNIQQTRPIYVQFSVPEQYLNDIRTYKHKGTLKVGAYFKNSGNNSKVEYGDLTFINNAIDTSTGTIMLKALFQNRNDMLWPGQYVNVTLTLTNLPDAVVVPTQAIQVSQQGQYVFVIHKNNIVETRPIVSNYSYDHESLIEKGVSPGEMVVTDGQLELVDGSKVEIKNKLDAGNTNQ